MWYRDSSGLVGIALTGWVRWSSLFYSISFQTSRKVFLPSTLIFLPPSFQKPMLLTQLAIIDCPSMFLTSPIPPRSTLVSPEPSHLNPCRPISSFDKVGLLLISNTVIGQRSKDVLAWFWRNRGAGGSHVRPKAVVRLNVITYQKSGRMCFGDWCL